MTRRAKVLIALGTLVAVVGLILSPVGQTFNQLNKKEFFRSDEQTRKFSGNSKTRLKALYVALMSYHDSEEHFPVSVGWMDAIENRLGTSDLKEGEAHKKLIRPDNEDKVGAFGYALNKDVSNRYKNDVKGSNAILVYESKQAAKNASGDPSTDGIVGGQAIALDGSFVIVSKPNP